MSRKIPSIEEVRDYFKHALEVRCVVNPNLLFKTDEIKSYYNYYYIGNILGGSNGFAVLWHKRKGYAEITKYSINDESEKLKPKFETRYTDKKVNGMDVIDLVKYWNLNFNEGNILKYLLRDKGDRIGDLKKIIDYTQRELKHINTNK